MNGRNALALLIVALLPSCVAGRVLKRQTEAQRTTGPKGFKRLLADETDNEELMWGEYIAGYPGAKNPRYHHVQESPEESKEESPEDLDPWNPSPWEEEQWDEYIAGYPGAKKPKHHGDPHPWFHVDPDPWSEKKPKGPKGGHHKPPHPKPQYHEPSKESSEETKESPEVSKEESLEVSEEESYDESMTSGSLSSSDAIDIDPWDPDPWADPWEPDPWEPNPWYDSSEEDEWGEYIAGYPGAHKPDPHPWYEEPDPWEPNPWYDSSEEEEWGEYIAGYPGAHEPDPHPWYEEPDPWSDDGKKPKGHDPNPWYDDPNQWYVDRDPWSDDGKKPKGHDPNPWYDDPDPWWVDGKHPKGPKGPKGHDTKDTKGAKVEPEGHDTKDTKGAKVEPEEHEKPHTGGYHYTPVYNRPHPVAKDEPNDPTGTDHDRYEDDYEDESEKKVIVQFVLQFTVAHGYYPSSNDLHLISSKTDVFLSAYLLKFFDEYQHDMMYDYFALVRTAETDVIVDGNSISIDYKGITFFETDTLPSVADMAAILEEAFLNENLVEYLRRLHETLPEDSIFYATAEATILTSVPDDESSKLFKTLEEEEAKSITGGSSGDSPMKVSFLALVGLVAGAAAFIALTVGLVAYKRQRTWHDGADDLSFVESVFIGDQGCLVEKEIGDEEFEVSSVSSNNATRAENFLRLVARDEDDDDYSGTSRFKIEMGGNKSAFARA